MPSLPIIANVFRCAIKWTNADGGLTATSVIHISAAGHSASDVANALDAHVQPHMFEELSTHTIGGEVDVTKLDGTSATLSTGLANWVGSSGAGDVIPASSVLVSFKTATRGRSFRGRVYLPFVLESASTYGRMPAANAAEIEGDWDAWLVVMAGAGFVPVVASYKHSTAATITDCFVPTQLATQRRRQGRLRFP